MARRLGRVRDELTKVAWCAWQESNLLPLARSTGDDWIRTNRDGFGDRVHRAESLVVTGIASNMLRIALSNRPDAGTIGLRLLAIKEPDAWAEKQRVQIESDLIRARRVATGHKSRVRVPARQLGASMSASDAVIEGTARELPAHEDKDDSNDETAESEVEQ